MPLVQNLIGTSSFRTQLQVAPVRQGFQVSASNQTVFTTNTLLNGHFNIVASNVQVYQNGAKLGYQDTNNKDYDITTYITGSSTGFVITLTNPAYYGDYVDITVFPTYLNDGSLKNPPGYIYQNFYDYWSANNNNLSWVGGNVAVGSTVSANTLDVTGGGAFGTFASTYTAPTNGLIVSGSVGVGISAPQQQLHVASNAIIGGTLTASNLNILGSVTTMYAAEYVSSNVVINNNGNGPALSVYQSEVVAQPVATFSAGSTQSLYIASSGNVAIGTTAAVRTLTVLGDINFSGGLYNNNLPFAFWSSSSNALYVLSSNVGIGMTNPAYSLDVVGTIRASADVFAYSDLRLKRNIATIKNPLDTIDVLRGVSYNRIDLYGRSSIGLIAQEVAEVLPEVISYNNKDDIMSISYGNIVGLLIEGIKDLRRIVMKQDERIAKLEALQG